MLYNQSGDKGKGNTQIIQPSEMWGEDKQVFFKTGQLYFYLFLNVPNYWINLALMSAKLVLFHTMAWNCSPKLLGQAGVIQQLHCKEEQLLQGRAEGKLTLNNFPGEFGSSPSMNYLRWLLRVHPALGIDKSNMSEELGIVHWQLNIFTSYSPPIAQCSHTSRENRNIFFPVSMP